MGDTSSHAKYAGGVHTASTTNLGSIASFVLVFQSALMASKSADVVCVAASRSAFTGS
jgi:hypothetical protein